MLTRRDVLRHASIAVAGTAGATLTGCTQLHGAPPPKPLRIGLVTDIHYADKDAGGTRYYRDSLDKLTTAVDCFNARRTDFVVELGDFIDAAPTLDEETGYLERINAVFARANCPRHYVLGNHCVSTLTKERFLGTVGASRSFYSFNAGGMHFVILDACFRHDGVPYGNKNSNWKDANIPPHELEWLQADLNTSRRPTVVFVHQRLDIDDAHGIKNRAAVRGILEGAGRVLAVFQGHHHINDLRQINGIHYCTLAALIEGPGAEHNAYGVLTLSPSEPIRIEGFGQQVSQQMPMPTTAATSGA